MRKREEIEKEVPLISSASEDLIIEVLLDIRELLEKQEERAKLRNPFKDL